MKKGISGGEKKRVSIATELLDDPALLCLGQRVKEREGEREGERDAYVCGCVSCGRICYVYTDEPTSGLDAALAYDMLKLLVQLAK